MPAREARPEKRGQKYRAVIEVKGPKNEKQFKKFYLALKAVARPGWVHLTEKKPRKRRPPTN